MVKSVTLIKRKQGISRDEFIKHYEEVHVPLVLKHFSFKRYVRNHIIPPGVEEAKFDCITEIWYDNWAECHACTRFWQSDNGHELRADEHTFMDRDKSVYFLVEEKTTI